MRFAAPFAVIAALAGGPLFAQSLTPEQVKELALEAILENPQIVMDAVAILQEREAAAAAEQAALQLSTLGDALVNDPNAPVMGNPDGDVTVVEFFDYNCPYCRRASPAVKGVLATDPNVRVVYREWPILGPESVVATRAALAAREQDKYADMHWAMMEFEGRLSENVIMQIAGDVGLDIDKLKVDMQLPAIDAHIAQTTEMARGLNFNGTPAFVIGDQTVPGFIEQAAMEDMIARARQGG
ncbi:MAG: DsbA family protein [Litoreibacter sp.]